MSKILVCGNCGTDAGFEEAEDGTYILCTECECGEFGIEYTNVQPKLPEYKRGELTDEKSRAFKPIYGDGEPPF